MEFRRSGQRDERRRRVLLDEELVSGSEAGETSSGSASTGSKGAPSYTDAARPERQARITDFLPLRPWTLLILQLAGLTVVAAIESLYACMPVWEPIVGRSQLAAIDLAERGTLASWFASVLLAGASLAAWLIYTLRRHKVDDYRGRYRVWLWASLFWLLASIDATAGATGCAAALLVRLVPSSALAEIRVLAVVLYVVVWGGLGFRLAIEMRRSRGALTTIIAAAVVYLLVAGLRLGVLRIYDTELLAMTSTGLALTGHLLLLLSMGVYARYVKLDALGRITVRARKPRRAKTPARAKGKKSAAAAKKSAKEAAPDAESTSTGKSAGKDDASAGKQIRIDSPHTPAGPAHKRGEQAPASPLGKFVSSSSAASASGSAKSVGAQISRADLDDDGEGEDEEGSRAERRRLRKLQRRQQK